MMRKLMVALLSVTMAASVFTACGKAGGSGQRDFGKCYQGGENGDIAGGAPVSY